MTKSLQISRSLIGVLLTASAAFAVDYHLFNSSFPHEHFDSNANQTANGYGPTTLNQLKTVSVNHFKSPFVFLTRTQGELYLLGGVSNKLGSTGFPITNYIAKVDPLTLEEIKRTSLDCPHSACPFDQVWGPSGAMHDNGFIYVVAESRVWKLDNEINVIAFYDLPYKDGSYNSMKVLSDGNMIFKFMGNNGGADDLSSLTILTPELTPVIAQFQPAEKANGRISVLVRNNLEYVYYPGVTTATRYRYTGGTNPSLVPDPNWSYTFRTPTSTQIGPAGIMSFIGDNAYFMDNCIPNLPHEGPIHLYRINLDNVADAQIVTPWPNNLNGLHFNKHLTDPYTGVIVAADETGKRMAGYRYAGNNQMVKLWDLGLESKIIASASNGRLYTTTLSRGAEDLLILDIVTGQTLARINRVGSVNSSSVISVGNNNDIFYSGGLNNTAVRVFDRR